MLRKVIDLFHQIQRFIQGISLPSLLIDLDLPHDHLCKMRGIVLYKFIKRHDSLRRFSEVAIGYSPHFFMVDFESIFGRIFILSIPALFKGQTGSGQDEMRGGLDELAVTKRGTVVFVEVGALSFWFKESHLEVILPYRK